MQYEFRLTPPSQEPITDWKIKDSFSVLVVFEEGEPNGSPKLHYHGYLETNTTIKTIQRWLNDVGESDKYNVRGNALFSTRKAHEYSTGYISKCRKCVLRHGTEQTTLDEWYTKSDQYVKEKANVKKRSTRSRQDELQPIYDAVTKSIKQMISPDEHAIIREVLYRCKEQNVAFPTRMSLEKFVNWLMYDINPERVVNYFHKSYQFIS